MSDSTGGQIRQALGDISNTSSLLSTPKHKNVDMVEMSEQELDHQVNIFVDDIIKNLPLWKAVESQNRSLFDEKENHTTAKPKELNPKSEEDVSDCQTIENHENHHVIVKTEQELEIKDFTKENDVANLTVTVNEKCQDSSSEKSEATDEMAGPSENVTVVSVTSVSETEKTNQKLDQTKNEIPTEDLSNIVVNDTSHDSKPKEYSTDVQIGHESDEKINECIIPEVELPSFALNGKLSALRSHLAQAESLLSTSASKCNSKEDTISKAIANKQIRDLESKLFAYKQLLGPIMKTLGRQADLWENLGKNYVTLCRELTKMRQKWKTMIDENQITNTTRAQYTEELSYKYHELQDDNANLQALVEQLEQKLENTNYLAQQESRMKSQAVENLEFLESESRMMSDSIQELEMELDRKSTLLAAKEERCLHLEHIVSQLRDNLKVTEEELQSTKSSAHTMLLRQGAELADIAVAVSALQDSLADFHEQLHDKAIDILGIEEVTRLDALSSSTDKEAESPGDTEPIPSSFVAAILRANDPDYDGNDHGPSQTEPDRLTSLESQTGPPELTTVGQLGELHTVFMSVVRLASRCDYDRYQTIDQLKKECISANERIEEMTRKHQLHVEELVHDLSTMETRAVNANVKLLETSNYLQTAQERVSELESIIEKTNSQRVTTMEQNWLVERLQMELSELREENRGLHAERTTLQKQLVTSIGEKENIAETANVFHLEREVSKLKSKLRGYMEKEQDQRSTLEKAARRMKTLEQNWKMAESEVTRLDRLIDHVVTSLGKSNLTPDLKALRDELQGIQDNGSSPTLDPSQLSTF